MAMWKKALVLVVASLVVALPVVTQVAMARPLILGVFPTKQAAEQALGTSSTASQSSVVLPQGKELSDVQLRKTDGEGVVTALIGLAVGAGTEYARERISREKPNLKLILLSAGVAALTWGIGVPDARAMEVAAKTARVAARTGAVTASLGARVMGTLNRYIGGPILRGIGRLFGRK